MIKILFIIQEIYAAIHKILNYRMPDMIRKIKVLFTEHSSGYTYKRNYIKFDYILAMNNNNCKIFYMSLVEDKDYKVLLSDRLYKKSTFHQRPLVYQ